MRSFSRGHSATPPAPGTPRWLQGKGLFPWGKPKDPVNVRPLSKAGSNVGDASADRYSRTSFESLCTSFKTLSQEDALEQIQGGYLTS